MASWHGGVDRLFEESLRGLHTGPRKKVLEGTAWSPAVDILDMENEIVLRADLPGLDPKDVDIQVQNGTLTLRGERKFESDVKEDNFRRVERVYGSFIRSFSLPQSVDSEKVAAEYKNGVLELTLPKRPEAKPKQIKVAVK
ncbi:MAG: Hsp20/alpha crystallin family protein [Candidatus Acidiferrales bacterium]